MLVPMTKVQIIGRRSDVGRMVEELHQLGLVEIADARSADAVEKLGGEAARAARRGELQLLAAQIDVLLAVLPPDEMLEPATRRPLDAGAARAELERLSSEVAALSRRLDALHDERLGLPSYLEPLRLLLPLVPELADLADLDDQQLQRLRLGTVALVLNTEDEQIVTMLRDELAEELAGHVHVAWTRVDDGAIGCLVVFPP